MKHFSKIIKSIFISGLFFTGIAHATDSGLDEFYAQPPNQAAYKRAVEAGALVKARQFFVNTCKDAKAKGVEKTLDCRCVEEQVANISDEVFFYETIQSYQEFQARAQLQGDAEKLKALKVEQSKRESLTKQLGKACG
ncbi:MULTISPECIES: hypothetical protein [unclassified Motilimonas]|uniref:hypothetical protein n=1 Tax=Motilimonas TaxID=1914248 RepID=UPI001E3FE0D9|nr:MULTISPECIES: hypothetical protein [unclassified Motilimonas]MCE0556911.1 hypothetical protein [Motilimonas sp. E26]MDO6525538.1 hypothetical protein [Motilimonas sp. 1_MG-2023]